MCVRSASLAVWCAVSLLQLKKLQAQQEREERIKREEEDAKRIEAEKAAEEKKKVCVCLFVRRPIAT